MLPFYLVFAAVLFPSPAAGQTRAFAVELEVAVRADLFACKETSELDRLLQRNQSGGFASGTQLYDYLKGAQMHWSDCRPRASVRRPRSIRLYLRSEKQQDDHLSLRLDETRDAFAMISQ